MKQNSPQSGEFFCILDNSLMTKTRPIHPDFVFLLSFKEQRLIDLFKDLREYILSIHPDINELLYHTHALTALFTVSEKAGNALCMINIFTNHLNLGFNKGTLLKDPHELLHGTGNLIRHIPIDIPADYRNRKLKDLVKAAAEYAMKDVDKSAVKTGQTISKIKPGKKYKNHDLPLD
ncbi:MAG TPA: DUF1801 domain-containing protein [Chitinophagaceae bacterium]|jgi:hypothetical protein|nr:DUF1801 domain-containing protein [Chitinophagaceae bacterium]